MKNVEIKGNMNSKRKLIMSLFWINKKVAGIEGCEPFLIEKIITETNIYAADKKEWIKLSEWILEDILLNLEMGSYVQFKINFGKEKIDVSIHQSILSISVKLNKELENEIVKKLELEGKKMYPNICSKFPKRIGVLKYP
jgi:hypothetical protein